MDADLQPGQRRAVALARDAFDAAALRQDQPRFHGSFRGGHVHERVRGGVIGMSGDDLAAAFRAPRERIHADVTKILSGLAEKKLLEL